MKHPVWGTLTPEQMEYGRLLGERRYANAVEKDRQPGNGVTTDPAEALQIDINGAEGEKLFDVFQREKLQNPVQWHEYRDHGINRLPDFDVDIDVKTSPTMKMSVKQGSVIPHWIYVPVYSGQKPRFAIVGWCFGADILTIPLKGTRPAHFVPYNAPFIQPIHTLLDELKRRHP